MCPITFAGRLGRIYARHFLVDMSMRFFKFSYVNEGNVLLVLWDVQWIAIGLRLEEEVLWYPAFVLEGTFKNTLLDHTEVHANALAHCRKPFFVLCNGHAVDEYRGIRAAGGQTFQVLLRTFDTLLYSLGFDHII